MSNMTEIGDIDMKVWSELVERYLSEQSHWAQFLLLFIMLLIFIVGLVGNLLTCVVIYYDKTMHTATNYYLFHLAISDLLVTLAITLEIHEYFGSDHRYQYYSFGEIACKIHFFLVVSLWNNGILIMTALAAERYVAICYPLILQSAPVLRRVMKIIVIIWIVAIIEALPEIWTVRLIKTKKASLCFIIPTPFAKMINGILAVVTFLIPLAIMTFVYAMIAFQVNIVQKKAAMKARIFNHRNNTKKVNKLITLTVSFLVCWLPFFTIRIFIFSWDAKRLIEVDEWWTFWCQISVLNNWFSAVLNPLLFSLMSTKFRQSLKKLWNKKVRGRQQQLPELYSRTTAHV